MSEPFMPISVVLPEAGTTPADFGGNKGVPYPNMRTEIRWRHYLRDSEEVTRDIQWVQFDYDETTR